MWGPSRIKQRYVTVLGGMLLLSLLTACGASASSPLGADHSTTTRGASASAATTAPATAATGATASKTVTAILNGCPVKQEPANAAIPTGAVVVQQSTAMEQQVTARQGQALVVHLKPELRWTLNVQDPSHALLASTPNGWYDAGLNACVWRFSVVSQGTATLTFSGTVICQPGTVCPHVVLEQDVTISAS